MRRYALALLATLLLAVVGDHAVLARNASAPQDNCDARHRKDNPNLQRAKEAKKAQLRARGYPERFMKLIDREECIACVEIASDAFHIMIVYKDNDYAPTDYKTGKKWTHVSHVWDPETEIQAREKTKDGTIKGFYILNTLTKGCICCGDTADGHTSPQSYSDWDDDLGANKDHLIPFDESNLGPLPDDLVNPSDKWVGDPIPIVETFTKPGKKQAHAPCKGCEGDAAKLNAAYDAVDALWTDKIAKLDAREVKEVELAKAQNEIRLLWYRQRSATMRSAANQARIEELDAVEKRLTDEIRAGAADVEAIDAKIAASGPGIEALENALSACASRCTTTEAAATNTFTPRPDPPSTPPTSVTTPPSTGDGPRPSDAAACPECQRAADYVQRLRTGLEPLRQELAALDEQPTPGNAAMRSELRDKINQVIGILGNALGSLLECNRRCNVMPYVPPPPAPGPLPECPECQRWADLLKIARSELASAEKRPFDKESIAQSMKKVNTVVFEMRNCNRACYVVTPIAPPPLPPVETLPPPSADPPRKADACFGDSCGSTWAACEASGTCEQVESDCGIPGVCTDTSAPGEGIPPLIDLTNTGAWTTSVNIDIDTRIQEKFVDLFDPASFPHYAHAFQNASSSIVIPPIPSQGVRHWFDPLGLLARRLIDNIDRWRGSVGPRPLIMQRDLELVERVSGGQVAGVPKGVHVLLNDLGGSTGKTLAMQILNLSGQPVRLSAKPFAVQPIKQQAQQQLQQAFNRLAKAAPVRLDLSAYCVEFLKAPPGANTLLTLAPANVQQKYASMAKVLQSAYRVQKAGALRPDSNPAAYTDSIKQWAIWTVEQKLNESRYTAAFVGHTKKNVEAAGQQWSKPAEDMVRKVSPNRWRDIVKVLQGAGVPVPQ